MPAEARVAHDVLQRFAVRTACHQRAELVEFRGRERLVEIQVEVHALLDAEPEADDIFRVEACVGNALLLEEDLGAVQYFKYGHLRHCITFAFAYSSLRAPGP